LTAVPDRDDRSSKLNMVDDRFEFVEEVSAYQGVRYGMSLVRERLPDGRVAERDVVRHPGAAVVLAMLDDGRCVLVEQHRTALGRNMIELPAGVLEAGEDPTLAAQRELEEETGYRARRVEKLLEFHPTAGLCDELMHIYLATDLERTEQNLDHDEFIDVHLRSLEEIQQLIRDGLITDGKTIAAVLYLAAFCPEVGMRGEDKSL